MSNISFRNNNKVISAKSYMQNGLVAHWDGIENDGYGNHSLQLQSWNDLVSNVPLQTRTDQLIAQNAVCVSQGTYIYDCNNMLKSLMDSVVSGEYASYTFEVTFPNDLECKLQQLAYLRTKPVNNDICFSKSYDQLNAVIDPYLKENNTSSIKMLGRTISEPASNQVTHTLALTVEDGTSKKGWLNGKMMHQFQYAYNLELVYFCCKGPISSIRVYNRTLDSDELLNNYEIDDIRFSSHISLDSSQ